MGESPIKSSHRAQHTIIRSEKLKNCNGNIGEEPTNRQERNTDNSGTLVQRSELTLAITVYSQTQCSISSSHCSYDCRSKTQTSPPHMRTAVFGTDLGNDICYAKNTARLVKIALGLIPPSIPVFEYLRGLAAYTEPLNLHPNNGLRKETTIPLRTEFPACELVSLPTLPRQH